MGFYSTHYYIYIIAHCDVSDYYVLVWAFLFVFVVPLTFKSELANSVNFSFTYIDLSDASNAVLKIL